jgi:hypothetical protein
MNDAQLCSLREILEFAYKYEHLKEDCKNVRQWLDGE